MKLSDIMGAADLSIYAEVGLVLFMAAFMGVLFRLFFAGGDLNFDEVNRIPLREERGPRAIGDNKQAKVISSEAIG